MTHDAIRAEDQAKQHGSTASLRAVVESWSKTGLFLSGILYFVGFVVASIYLSQYGVASGSLVRSHYVISGFWCLLPILVTVVCSATASASFMEAFEFSGRSLGGRILGYSMGMFQAAGASLGLLFLLFLFTYVLFGLPVVGLPFVAHWKLAAKLGAFCIGLFLSLGLALLTFSNTTNSKRERIETYSLGVINGAVCAILTFWYISFFSLNVYPLIPFEYGGGKPLSVVFLLKTDARSSPLVREDSGEKSIPYQLLATTDSEYVVISPSGKEKAIEFSREAVTGVIVLGSKKQ